jgi:hypothetical protein
VALFAIVHKLFFRLTNKSLLAYQGTVLPMPCRIKPKPNHHPDCNHTYCPPILFHGFLSTAVDITYKKYFDERGPEFFILGSGTRTRPLAQ